MLIKLEGFKNITPFELNMGYYNIGFTKKYIIICMIILPWVNISIND